MRQQTISNPGKLPQGSMGFGLFWCLTSSCKGSIMLIVDLSLHLYILYPVTLAGLLCIFRNTWYMYIKIALLPQLSICFERPNGLDTALYKILPLPFNHRHFHVVTRHLWPSLSRMTRKLNGQKINSFWSRSQSLRMSFLKNIVWNGSKKWGVPSRICTYL